MKKQLVIFSGAGISAESGINTFRDAGGLWENHRIEDVATPEAFAKNPALVLQFYNQRRKQVLLASPNAAHIAIAKAEEKFDVSIITQNIDNLHERAGSSKVFHLHGEIIKAKNCLDDGVLHDVSGTELNIGDVDEHGNQLRPHVVWFGESVPMIEKAIPLIKQADILIVVGTSLNVYPAAGIIEYAKHNAKKYLIDPHFTGSPRGNFNIISESATSGIPVLLSKLSE